MSEGDRGRRRFFRGCFTIFGGLAFSGVGTKGSVTISSLVAWMGLVTGGWAVVLVLVVEIVRVGADEVKTTLDSLAAATSSARRTALVKVFGKKNQGLGQGPGPGPGRGRFVRQVRGPGDCGLGRGRFVQMEQSLERLG